MAGAGRGFIENVTKNQQRALNIQLGQQLFQAQFKHSFEKSIIV